jgi:multiple sugar transport system permease protein
MRLLIALLYGLLSLGAATMVYPFIVMVGTSVTSPVDKDEFRPVPAYLRSDVWLYRKYVEAKYNENLERYNVFLSSDLASFKELQPPAAVWTPGTQRQVAEWQAFRATLPLDAWLLGSSSSALSKSVTPEMVVRYREFLRRRYGSLERVNEAYRQANLFWRDVKLPREGWDRWGFPVVPSPEWNEFLEFKQAQPRRQMIVITGDALFQEWLRLTYGSKAADLNRAWGTHYGSRFDVRLEARVPGGRMEEWESGRMGAFDRLSHSPTLPFSHSANLAAYRADWEKFVRKELPSHFIRIDPAAAALYRRALAAHYRNIATLNQAQGTHFASFDAIPLPDPPPVAGRAFADWGEFIQRSAPVEAIRMRTPDALYREELRRRYGTLAALNAAYGTAYSSWDAPQPPFAATDWQEMAGNRTAIRREFLARNYRDVLDYMALHGPAVWNTFVLCAGLLVVTLVVNPLCAYALSRFNLPATYQILLFLLATMAFPAEVSAIPNFLLLKQLRLLNTYWALILPAMANGYSIFLLKGFFDSLPKELYEAGTIDGATEARMFRMITLPMSKPVLAVIALGTFTAAYGSFLWAFLVCQDPQKWTLMVWLSQMQETAPMPVVFAALVLAAIPTLLVFVFCQNIIMRGIIVPTEK